MTTIQSENFWCNGEIIHKQNLCTTFLFCFLFRDPSYASVISHFLHARWTCPGRNAFQIKDFLISDLAIAHHYVSMHGIYSTNLVTNLLIKGIISMLVGKATTNPITQALRNLKINPSFHPVFIIVIVKVIVVSKAIVIKKATKKPEYFLSSFKWINHPPSCSSEISVFSFFDEN